MPNISIRIPDNIKKHLNEYVDKTNLTKTEIMIRALTEYLGIVHELPFPQRLSEVERRLSEIEKLIIKDQ